jgi:hypothetical protein
MIQPQRRAKRITPCSVASALAEVFAERPSAPQLVQQLGDVVDRERGDRSLPEGR